MAKVVDVEFERGEALLHHPPRPRRATLRRARGIVAIAAVGIEADAVAELAAEQPVEGLARGLRRKVPQRDLDAAQRDQEDAALRAREDMIAAELLPAIFDIARILADQFGFQFRNQANDRACAGVGIGFAIAR